MKVGWYSHHLLKTPENGSESLLGVFEGMFAGGAEMTDFEYKKFAPENYEIHEVAGDTWIDPEIFDTIIITGTESFNDSQLLRLSAFQPFVFVHHLQKQRSSLRTLINSARIFVTHTPAHMQKELLWTEPKKVGQVLSAFDTSEIVPADKIPNSALWAARNHPLKGKLYAQSYAIENELDLTCLTDRPREEVLKQMATTKHFLHFPLAFESECRAVMEAVLSGCNVVTNNQVGITSVEDWNNPEVLKNMIDKAGDTFWRLVNQ